MPMVTLAQVRAAIKAKLEGISGMGAVNDYQRHLKDWTKLVSLYTSSAQGGARLYGWDIHRRATVERLVSTGRNYRDVAWKLRVFMSLDDADGTPTQKRFDDQIEAACDAFRADMGMGGLCETHFEEENNNQAGLQLEDSGHALFAGVLCHAATLNLITRVYTNT